LIDKAKVGEIPFALGAFLCQDVTLKSMLSFDFSGAGELKTLFRAGIRLHFRHDPTFFFKLIYLIISSS